MANSFEIRACVNPTCGLRYPLTSGHPFGIRCPKCLGETSIARTQIITVEPEKPHSNPAVKIKAFLDNIRSAWNVGSVFRTADCFGVDKLYLCGITPTPENPAVCKTSLGAEISMPWEYSPNALEKATNLRNSGVHLWALEQDPRSTTINLDFRVDENPIVLILGNEVCGVDPDILDLSEHIVHIPMFGRKRSLNVEVAFGSALSIIRHQL